MLLSRWLANVKVWRKSIAKSVRHAVNVGLGLYVIIGLTDQLLHFKWPLGRPTIQQRVDAVRLKLEQDTSYQKASYQVETDEAGPARPGQWWNWGNWPNYWNNWPNMWLNYYN